MALTPTPVPMATGIGFSEVAYVLSKGELWLRVPESVKINVLGQAGEMVFGKDIFLYIAGKLGDDGALYRAVEWAGPAVQKMSLASRMTLANMSVEIGAKNGIIEPNGETLAFLKARAKREFEIVKGDADAKYEAIPGQCQTGLGRSRRKNRPGIHRLVHQRQAGRPARRGRHPQGPEGPP